MIGGNQINYNFAQVARPNVLSRRLLSDPVTNALAAPPGFDELQSKLGKERVVILRGPAGCGKQAVGVRLLLNFCGGGLCQLNSVSDIPNLEQWLDPEHAENDHPYGGAGFVLAYPQGFADLISNVLQGPDEALTRADARLVIGARPRQSARDSNEEGLTMVVSRAESSFRRTEEMGRTNSSRSGRLTG